jgi:hypothetical protein
LRKHLEYRFSIDECRRNEEMKNFRTGNEAGQMRSRGLLDAELRVVVLWAVGGGEIRKNGVLGFKI